MVTEQLEKPAVEALGNQVTGESRTPKQLAPYVWQAGQSGNLKGRPKRTYQDIAANRPEAKKVAVVVAQERAAIERGSTRAAEFLRDTAEGKPATRIIVQASASMNELMNEWEVEAAGDAVVALQLKEAADGN